MEARSAEGPVGFLSLRLERTDVGLVATIVTNPDVADRLGDRAVRLTDPVEIHRFAARFIADWLSNTDPVTHG
jgi:hypothetical protein